MSEWPFPRPEQPAELSSDTAPAGYGAPPTSYPPPPEFYQRAAQAAPTPGVPSYPPKYDGARPAAVRRPRIHWRLQRTFYSHQAISELDVALLVVSAAISFLVYQHTFGWQLGLGLIILLFVHEMGHFVVIRAKGLPAQLPIFVPFVGAFVLMRSAPLSARDDAEIALAGPFAGALGSLVCLLAFWPTRWPMLLTLALINLGINLFNLMPIYPLDGARASWAIERRFMVVALVVVAIAGMCVFNALLTLIAVVSIILLLVRPAAAPPGYYLSRRERNYVTALYFGLMGGILMVEVGMFVVPEGLGWLWIVLWLIEHGHF